MKKGCCSKLKKLFFHPKSFFSEVEKEKNYSKIMFFYVKVYIAMLIINLAFSFFSLMLKNNLNLTNSASLIYSFIIGVGLAFVLPFVYSAIIHLGVLIFKGKQKYFNTYKPLTYALVIGIIYNIISIIISFLISIIFPVNASSISPDLLLKDTNFIISQIISLIIMIVALIHILHTATIGILKFQKLSKLKAFLSIILIPIILIIILIVIAVLIYNYQYSSIA